MTRPLLVLTLAVSLPSLAAAQTASPYHDLMPAPASVQFTGGKLRLDSAFSVAARGIKDGRLERGVARMIARIERHTGLVAGRDTVNSTPPEITVVAHARGDVTPALGENESYTLTVTDSGAVLDAPTVIGALRGMQTLIQLVEGDRDGYYLPTVEIADHPRFPWRGLLVDVGRHFEPVSEIERTLDGMAAVKLNVLHWHLSEDQGFRVESKLFPKLQAMGSDGKYYTQEQIRAVVAYAKDRGIRVVPEFDMPGHATSWFVGYPRYASAPGPYEIQRAFGVFDPTFDPTRESTYKFLDAFIGEMAHLFPDAYWHIGGDETTGNQWRGNPRIVAFMKAHRLADAGALQAYFNGRLEKILAAHGKHMVGWDEILHKGLPKNAVIQSWRGQKFLGQAAQQGYSGILSAGFYLDHMQTAATHYQVEPLQGLNGADSARVLGGEACMWGEHVNPVTIDSRIWPRLAAIAERFWSPRNVTDVDDMYRRLAAMNRELSELGLDQQSSTDRLLRTIAGHAKIAPLKEITDVVEPVSFGRRSALQKTTQLTPLVRLVDAAVPDVPARRAYQRMVDSLVADKPDYAAYRGRLIAAFTAWRDLPAQVDAIAAQSPLADDAIPVAQMLSDLGEAGLEAITYLSQGVAPPPGWREAREDLLTRASGPIGLVHIAVTPALKTLIEAAATSTRSTR